MSRIQWEILCVLMLSTRTDERYCANRQAQAREAARTGLAGAFNAALFSVHRTAPHF